MLISERLDPIDFRPYFQIARKRISTEDSLLVAESYQNGCSLRDLSKQFGLSKTTIRKLLAKQQIKLRPKVTHAQSKYSLKPGKASSLPYFGFCYFEGKVTKDPREFPTLLVIHNQWLKNKTIHQITQYLNQAKLSPRKCKAWSWAAVSNIVARFKNKKIILKQGGKYELR